MSKKFLGLMFNCCNVYNRVYINKDGSAYVGRCPRCAMPVRIPIGEGGVGSRFFEVR